MIIDSMKRIKILRLNQKIIKLLMQVMIKVTSGRFGKGPTKRVGFYSQQVFSNQLPRFSGDGK